MAKGKYAHVIAQLPRLLGTEPAYQEKVEAVMTAMKTEPDFKLHASALVQRYAALRQEHDDAEDALADVNLRLEAVSQMMAEQYEVEGVTSMKTSSGRSVSIYQEPYARVEDAAAFQRFCFNDLNLRGRLTLPWQTMNALTKERLLAGEPEPPGVTIYSKTKIRLGSE